MQRCKFVEVRAPSCPKSSCLASEPRPSPPIPHLINDTTAGRSAATPHNIQTYHCRRDCKSETDRSSGIDDAKRLGTPPNVDGSGAIRVGFTVYQISPGQPASINGGSTVRISAIQLNLPSRMSTRWRRVLLQQTQYLLRDWG